MQEYNSSPWTTAIQDRPLRISGEISKGPTFTETLLNICSNIKTTATSNISLEAYFDYLFFRLKKFTKNNFGAQKPQKTKM